MKQELSDKLISSYPFSFKKLKYIECADGWYDLLNTLFSTIEGYLKTLPVELRDQIYAEQVKQKFGYLRVYFSKNLSYIDGAIDVTEALSTYFCEMCGKASNKSNDPYHMQSICDNCNSKEEATGS